MSAPPPTQKDANQVLRYSFDDATGTIRTTTTLEPGGSDLEIHYTDDSIAIGDPATDNILGITVNHEAKVDITAFGDVPVTLGQKTSINSIPVVLSSDQSSITVVGTITGSPNVNIHDSTGGSLNSTSGSLNVDVTNTVTVIQPTGSNLHVDVDNFPATQAVTQSTSPWVVSGTVTANAGTGTFLVDGSAHTQPISGTVTTTQGTSPWVENLTQVGGSALTLGQKTSAASIPVVISSDQSPIAVTGTITTSPNVNVHDGTGVSISSTGSSLNVDVTNTIPVSQSGSWSVTANAGTNLNTSALALDTSVTGLQVSQGSTTSGEKGSLVQGAVTTSAPTYTTGQTNPLSLTTSGALRTDSSGSTQPVSGTVTVNQGTSPWVDNITQFGSNPVVTGTGTSGLGIPRVTVSNDSNILATQSGTWNINNVTGTISLPTGASTSANQTTIITNQTNASQKTQIVDGSGNVDTIKAATIQSTTADTALVTTPRPTVGTITQSLRTIGTTALRATVSGSAPAATRSLLAITADAASTAKFYIGSSTVTSSGATAGIQFTSTQPVIFNNDAADYWIISDTAGQSVYFMEQT